MSEAPPTFSESWYRIADQQISLRPGVKIRRQFFRGEQWHVVEDPFNNQFFRLQPPAYSFVARLRPHRTVQQVWEECLALDPNQAPGQEEVLRLISQLYFANLLQYEAPTDSAQLFERQRRRRERETRSRWLNIMFLRIPLFDPDRFIDRLLPHTRWLFGPVGLILWLLVVGAGVKVVVENFAELRQQSQGVLAPGNLFLLYLGLVIIKSLHEFGHAFLCKRFGGQVHVMGVMMLIFTPTPYMDATSSWGFRSRWQRMLVGAAGMIVEVFVATIAVFIWANTGPGTLHNLAYNMIFVASVSTILFNGNPLLRYDGYYMLSDFLGIPNLYQRATQQLKFWMDRYLFGLKKADTPARSRREAAWLTAYGILSFIYRIVVFGGILLFVADRFLLLGIIMAVVCLISWVIVPLGRFIHYLATSPQLERQRLRAGLVSAGTVLGLLGFLEFVPFPYHFRAPGIVEAREKGEVVNESPGIVETVLATPGSWVTNGQPLLRLSNHELDLQLVGAQARVEETQAMWRRSMQTNVANLKPIDQRLESVQKQLQQVRENQATLVVRAQKNGIWAAPEMKDFLGRWLTRGTDLGVVLNPASFEFTATVPQTDVNRLFASQVRGASVRLRGQAGFALPVGDLRLIPAAQNKLPSAALGWRSGGEVPIAPTDPEGRQAMEPFFEVKAGLKGQVDVAFWHGRSGKIRFNLDPEPLLQQWWRRLRQVLQKRYQL
jgi:putative peptide zinc metalloprotease protein